MKRIEKYFVLVVLCFLVACNATNKNKTSEQSTLKENEYRIYCLNKEGTKLSYYIREVNKEEQNDIIYELLGFLGESIDDSDCQPVIDESVKVQEIRIVKGRLFVYFSGEYYNIDPIKEVLVRAAIVKTLSQVEDIGRIIFYVDGKEQENAEGIKVGSMAASDFIDDTNDSIWDYNTVKITLYFTDEQGTKLYAEKREVYIDTRYSMEKTVLNELLAGAKSNGLKNVLPEGLTIISAITRDGVCYLNMDDTFLTGAVNVVETIPVYAIVNSLTEITGVEAVQILINGEMGKVYREAIRFDRPLEVREDLIADSE